MVPWYVYVLFVGGLVAVIKGGDWFVESAAWFAKKLGISEVIVGATVVSIGTTLPETMISSMAAFQGRGSVVLGTALGSILCNTGLILGLNHVVRPSVVRSKDTLVKMVVMAAALLVLAAISWNGSIDRRDSVILLSLFGVYIASNVWASKNAGPRTSEAMTRREVAQHAGYFVVGLALVVGGARIILDSGVLIARGFGISELVIAVTLFAVGSSLPEVVTSVTAALKGYPGLFLGNVIGANTLNVLMVTGFAGLVRPIQVDSQIVTMDIPIALGLMGIIAIPTFVTRRIGRTQGVIVFVSYLAYVIWLVMRG